MSSDLQDFQRKVQAQGFSALALSMVLPHEHKPVRFPVIPATHTALLDGMMDAAIPVYDNTSRKAFLCRDPCYPLWIEKRFTSCAGYLQSQGTNNSWTIPARANSTLILPNWDNLASAVGASPAIDGVTVTAPAVVDNVVLGNAPTSTAIFIPPGSTFCARIYTAAVGGGSGLELETVSQIGGEVFTSTLLLASTTDGFIYTGTAGATANSGSEGITPIGFTWITQLRTTGTAPTAAITPLLQFGWCTGTSVAAPSGTVDLFAPFAMPPEFNNSTLPYGRTRLNSSAALFSNVSAVLSREGTILAARLKPSIVDPWLFTISHLNSVHPSLRYFGPLEKGLYTFTTPSGNVSSFIDGWMTMPSNSATNSVYRPLFSFQDIGVYNAVVLTDLGSNNSNTQLAVSGYTHLEFETTSSLFAIGVSSHPIELLHATEVALLHFGHFHENPVHWATLASAVRQAVATLAPIAAPYLKRAAMAVVDRGVSMLTRPPSTDTKTRQAAEAMKPRREKRRARVRPAK